MLSNRVEHYFAGRTTTLCTMTMNPSLAHEGQSSSKFSLEKSFIKIEMFIKTLRLYCLTRSTLLHAQLVSWSGSLQISWFLEKNMKQCKIRTRALSGGCPFPKVLATTSTSFSELKLVNGYSSMQTTWTTQNEHWSSEWDVHGIGGDRLTSTWRPTQAKEGKLMYTTGYGWQWGYWAWGHDQHTILQKMVTVFDPEPLQWWIT